MTEDNDISNVPDRKVVRAVRQFFYNELLHTAQKADPENNSWSIYDWFAKQLNHAIKHHWIIWCSGRKPEEVVEAIVRDEVSKFIMWPVRQGFSHNDQRERAIRFKAFIEETVRDETRKIINERLKINTVSTVSFETNLTMGDEIK